MKTLSKTHKTQIEKMINDGDKVQWIAAYCKGAGFDTNSPSSPVYITDNKVCLTYRRNLTSQFVTN